MRSPASEGERHWALANVARCRSLLAAADGDLDVALAHAEDAVRRWEPFGMPIELARALITLGMVLRRRGERRAARDTLERARTLCSDVGAEPW